MKTLTKLRARISATDALLFFYAIAIYVFIFGPIGILVLSSFNVQKYITWPIEAYTFRWYIDMFTDGRILEAALNSLKVGLSATLISTLLGLLGAYVIVRLTIKAKSLLVAILLFPMIVPPVVAGVSQASFYSQVKFPLSLWTVILAHVCMALPFTTLIIATRLEGFNIHLEEIAQNLGATKLGAFGRVTLPIISPGIIGAALLAFTISFDEFVVTFFVIGPGNTTLPVKIVSMLRFGLSPSLRAMSALILIVSVIVILIAFRFVTAKRA